MSNYDNFKKAFKGDLVTPADEGYEKAIARWARNAVRHARIVAFVKDVEDVSLALKFAKKEGIPLAIMGGGHSVSGASSIEDGLVIDLSRYFTGVGIDPHKKLAYIQGGAVWKTVDEEAIKYGLAAVAGTVNHTGVGGLTLGGGFGFLTPKHGFVVDNLVEVTIVIADGTVLKASNEENPDLFWAVRGGGCNFGVVTEFVMKVHEQRKTVYTGMLMFPAALLDEVSRVTQEWWKNKPSENEVVLQLLAKGPPPEFAPMIAMIPFYNGTEEEGRQVFKPFLDLHPMDMTRTVPYEIVNSLINDHAVHGKCYYFRSVTQDEVQPELSATLMKHITEKSTPEFRVSLTLEHFPLFNLEKKHSDTTPFLGRGPHMNVLGVCSWDEDTPENQVKGKNLAVELTNIVADAQRRPDVSKTTAYGNYISDEFVSPDRSAKLFGSNYPRLQAIKKKYDPDMLFARWFVITPA